MGTPDPAQLQAAIEEGYLRYFDTAFWLRDDALMTERRELLQQAGNVFQDALIEPVPTYLTGPTVLEVCEGLQLDRSMADQLAAMLFDSDCRFELWVHQAQSLRVSPVRGWPGTEERDRDKRNRLREDAVLSPAGVRAADCGGADLGCSARPGSLVGNRRGALARLQSRPYARRRQFGQ